MLVLSRKKDEKILIADDIEITIISTGSKEVKLGIEAPKSVAIKRYELLEKAKEENIKGSCHQKDESKILNELKLKLEQNSQKLAINPQKSEKVIIKASK